MPIRKRNNRGPIYIRDKDFFPASTTCRSDVAAVQHSIHRKQGEALLGYTVCGA